uniref:Macaca fascicularis brain cDNA, clone: QflA-18873 n=1 Tax=Macaca fascicularis TaxID=9541 RepID=I7GMX3_MACFA|nr:unnamed protein product [Macaca fascicularis]
MLSYFCLSLCCAIITSLHFCWPSTSPTGQDCIVVFLCHPIHQCKIWKIARTQSIDAKLMNTLLAYIYGAFLVPMKQFHLSHMSVLCFTAAFSKEFCEKYGVLQHYSLVMWGFNPYLYFSGITRNNDCNYLSGKSLKFLFKEIVIVGEICKA